MSIVTDIQKFALPQDNSENIYRGAETNEAYDPVKEAESILQGEDIIHEAPYLKSTNESALYEARTAVEAAQPVTPEVNTTIMTPEQIVAFTTNAAGRVVGMRNFFVAGQDQDFISTIRSKSLNQGY